MYYLYRQGGRKVTQRTFFLSLSFSLSNHNHVCVCVCIHTHTHTHTHTHGLAFQAIENLCPLPLLPTLEWNLIDLEVALLAGPGDWSPLWEVEAGHQAPGNLSVVMPRKSFPFSTVCRWSKEITHETNSNHAFKNSFHPSHNIFGVRFTLQYFNNCSVATRSPL